MDHALTDTFASPHCHAMRKFKPKYTRLTAIALPLAAIVVISGLGGCTHIPPSSRPLASTSRATRIPVYAHGNAQIAIAMECGKIGRKLGSVSVQACNGEKLKASGALSVQGQPILFKEYPPLEGRKPRARILMIGGIHGDEYSAVSIVFRWMKKLDRSHFGLFHWYIVPLLNPDGLLQKKSSRLNANGVDLNRNFPTPDWYLRTRNYWEQRTHEDPRRYPGKAALSEPESRWLYGKIRDFQPDVIISIHAPYGVLDFDGPPKPPHRMGYLHLHLIGTYPGSLGNCAGVQHHIPIITLELPHAGIMPSQKETNRIWRDLAHWLKRNIPKNGTRNAYATFDDITRSLNSPSAPAHSPSGG